MGSLFLLSTRFVIRNNTQTVEQSIGQEMVSKPVEAPYRESSEELKQQSGISKVCIQLTDNYLNDSSLSKLYSEEDIIKRIQQFNKELNANANYYEISFQALQYLDYYSLGDDYVKIYNNEGGKIENQLVEIDGEECYVTSLNTIQVNENFNRDFLTAMGGNSFEKEDFILEELDRIPVILGNFI